VLVFTGAYILVKRRRTLKPHAPSIFVAAVLGLVFVLWCLYPRPSLYPTQTLRFSPQTALGFYLFPMGKGVVVKEQNAEFFLHREGDYRIVFSSRRELETVRLQFGSQMGVYATRMAFFDLPFFEGDAAYQIDEVSLSPATSYPFKRLHYYEINLSLKKMSSESMLIDPYFLKVTPVKER